MKVVIPSLKEELDEEKELQSLKEELEQKKNRKKRKDFTVSEQSEMQSSNQN